jgi:hypothetical protein
VVVAVVAGRIKKFEFSGDDNLSQIQGLSFTTADKCAVGNEVLAVNELFLVLLVLSSGTLPMATTTGCSIIHLKQTIASSMPASQS